MGTQKPKVRYSAELIATEMASRGWNDGDLARAAGVSQMTVTRFLRGDTQTAKMADRLAKAFGHSVRRYIVGAETAAP